MKLKLVLISVVVTLLVSTVIGLALAYGKWANGALRPLGYDDTHELTVGRHRVTIETRSLAIANKDKGLAELVVTFGEVSEKLDSSFNQDLYMNIRPAYLTRRDVDGDGVRDILIWRPNGVTSVEAAHFLSSREGCLMPLSPHERRAL